MKTQEEKISYSVICEQMPSPNLRFGTYKEAEDYAKIEQPAYRPYYIVEIVEHFEICGVVGDNIDGIDTLEQEPLTDTEQCIFLAAMGREEEVCREVDEKYPDKEP